MTATAGLPPPVYAPGTVLAFGRWSLRPAERTLSDDGVPVPLGGRAFDLLLALAEGRDSVVSKADLMDRVWPELHVDENNLAVQVSALRRLLGAGAVATVPGRGYRLTLLPSPAPQALLVSAPDGPAAATGAAAAEGCRPLPLRPGALIGRDDELQALLALLDERRLVTVRGAGGIGKSSLALAAAHARREQHPDAVAWIELAPVEHAAGIAGALCGALHLPVPVSADPWPAIADALRERSLLLFVDNAEHLADAVALIVARLLAQAPRVRWLVTSQVALKIDGEQLMPLRPLSLPAADDDCDSAQRAGAMALFVDQVRAADRGFRLTPETLAPAVAICHRLDGVPLALKLAAARASMLGLQGLLQALNHSMQWLAGGPRDAPERQRTVSAALAWSCSLLEPATMDLFCRLGVCVGSFSLPFALDMAGGPATDGAAGHDAVDELDTVERLATLVDRSLVESTPGEAPRYRLLQSARDHALQQLQATGQRDAAERRHASLMHAWAEAAHAAHWHGSDAQAVPAGLQALDNLRAALDFSARESPARAMALWGAAAGLLVQLGLDHEARQRCPAEPVAQAAGGVAAVPQPVPAPVLARYWLVRGRLHWNRASAVARAAALRAAELYRDLGDAQGLYLSLCLAAATSTRLQAADAAALLEEAAALERAVWPLRLRYERQWALIYACKHRGDSAGALAAAEAAGLLAQAAGADQLFGQSRAAVVSALLALGRVEVAIAVARAALQQQPMRHGRPYITALGSLFAALLMHGDTDAARPLLRRFLTESRRCGWEVLPRAADWCALLAAQEGRRSDAVALLAHADRVTAVRGGREHHEELARAQVMALLQPAPAVPASAPGHGGVADDALLSEEALCALALGSPPLAHAG